MCRAVLILLSVHCIKLNLLGYNIYPKVDSDSFRYITGTHLLEERIGRDSDRTVWIENKTVR